MSNHITIELCAEDRARLDRLTEALERRNCDACVASALNWSEQVQRKDAEKATPDPVQQRLTEVLAQAESHAQPPQEPVESTEAEAPATTQAPEEKPKTAADERATTPSVTVDDIRQRYVALVASGKKNEARDTIKSYNVAKISDIPADKCAEVLAKLNALEG